MSYDSRFFLETISDVSYRPFQFPVEVMTHHTWAYPFIGVYYFLTHPSLWSPALYILVPQVIITTAVFIFVHLYFFPPQALVAVFFNGPTGIFTAWIAILQQSGIISRFIIEKTLLPGPLKSIFDSVVFQNANDSLVAKMLKLQLKEKKEAQILKAKSTSELLQMRYNTFVQQWYSYISNPYYWLKATLIVFFNLIPFFGPYILVFLRSPGKGRNLHKRYFLYKNFKKEDGLIFFNAHRADYTAFGIVALNLELLPVIGMFFTYTNIVAAALWASEMEKQAHKKLQNNKIA